MNKTAIICLDCGTSTEGNGTPKEVAKTFKWTYVTKGKWRCPNCQAFQSQMNEQFGENTMGTIVVPGKEPY